MNDRTELLASFEGRVMGGVLHNGGYIHVPQEEAEQILALLKELLKKQHGWIRAEDGLPDSAYGCLVTVWDNNAYGDCFLNLLPYFVGWDGDRWNDCDGEECPFEIYAWMPLPELPKEEN